MSAEARPHILVVDDEPSVQEALGAALGRTYVVRPATTGDVACAVLWTRPIAGIILDAILVMGDKWGTKWKWGTRPFCRCQGKVLLSTSV